MPPPKPKRFFKIRRKADGLIYFKRLDKFMERGSRFKDKELLRVMRRLAQYPELGELEVVRYETTQYPPLPFNTLLERLEEHVKKDWPLF